MTNSEAKEIIIKERDSLKANPMIKVEDCLYEAFDVAIKALEQHQSRCDSCIHSEEQDGSNCYECVKGMADNFEAQPCDDCIRELIREFDKKHPSFEGYMQKFNNHSILEIIEYMWDMHNLIEDIEYRLPIEGGDDE